MHNNFYFLRQISKALESRLTGSVVSECYSQSKDELIVRFEIGAEPFMIRASVSPDLSCVSFPNSFQRARKNSIDLFAEAVGRRVLGVRQFDNERSFAIRLSDSFDLLFKMHGNRTNIILFRNGMPQELFRKKLTGDKNLSLEALDRNIDWGPDYFRNHASELKAAYFTFGKVVWKYLDERKFHSAPKEQQWESIRDVLQLLNDPVYYITFLDGKPVLSLLKVGDVKEVLRDPLVAANEFYHTFTQLYAFSRERTLLLNTLRSRMSAGENYCERNTERLSQVKQDDHYRLWADLIMANLHAIDAGAEMVRLENFYGGQPFVEVRLKKDLAPQKNAELYYKKAKNQHIEIETLENSIRQKREELAKIREEIAQVEAVVDLKSLRAMKDKIDPGKDRRQVVSLPYHEFNFRGYRILVGRNAAGNDLLTFKHSYKEDLWLHAKDVAGSHVLIKHQAGKNFPKDVIEYAASLAASNSKRKNESLCPVVVTPKKYVRKRKGDPPGVVVVDREEVVMVVPAVGLNA